jgi:hypothetical protein
VFHQRDQDVSAFLFFHAEEKGRKIRSSALKTKQNKKKKITSRAGESGICGRPTAYGSNKRAFLVRCGRLVGDTFGEKNKNVPSSLE